MSAHAQHKWERETVRWLKALRFLIEKINGNITGLIKRNELSVIY